VGDDCLLMTGAHVGHDAQIGDRVILVNQVAIAGHCVLGDDVIVGGLSGMHQWVRDRARRDHRRGDDGDE
jgi:UDP-N-acetylglucosamine acyltransferase